MRQRRLVRSTVLLCSILAVALFGASSAAGATFNADPTSLGAVPDGAGATCGTFGAARDVTFTASALGNHITNIEVTVQFSPVHTWGADFDVVLIAPNAVTHTIFSRTGSTTATGCGDSSDLGGPYTFSDLASAPPSGGWWESATVAASTSQIPTGTYRTTAPGGAGAVNPSPATLMTPAFTTSNPNGVWTLRIKDGATMDTGAVSAASITITAEDTIAPQTTIVKKPKLRTTKRRAVFGFKANETPATFQCKLGKRAYKPCASPKTYKGLTLGRHTVRIRAIDAAGNKDATPATYTWRIVRG